jgi:predicted DCC family thiol-disulfide oxidoreductase YuxK
MSSLPERLIVFDGVCVLCNRFTSYVLRNDSAQSFCFTSYQNLQERATEYELVLPKNLNESIAYYRKDRFYHGSTAILMIFKDLYAWFHWSQLGWLAPRIFRDYLYAKVAHKRYAWFGKLSSCVLPESEIKHRFL